MLEGKKEKGLAWDCRVGCCCSEVCLVGPEVYWLERKQTELQGPKNFDERKLLKLPLSALERWAIEHFLQAYTDTS